MITVRKATLGDARTIVEYIAKKAEFDRQLGCFEGKIAATPERISKALFGEPVFAYTLLAVRGEQTVGFAFYHFQFSSFQGRPRLWLDDLYVDAGARRCGAGLALMSALAAAASEHDCTELAWIAASNNPSGIPFYAKLRARQVSEQALGFTYAISPAGLATRIAEIQAPRREPRG